MSGSRSLQVICRFKDLLNCNWLRRRSFVLESGVSRKKMLALAFGCDSFQVPQGEIESKEEHQG